MSKIELDFNTLKYNLYEILNVKSESDESKIRKSFIKLIKTFHPDKNSKLEEDIYYHIILSNQILLNKESRIKYDKFLEAKIDNFNELKGGFSKLGKGDKKQLDSETIKEFNNKIELLNKTHSIKCNISDNISTMDKYNKLLSTRNNINIDKEDIKTTNDFNTKFNEYKQNGKFKDQMIVYNDNVNELTTYTGDSYVTLNHIEKLYLDDTITTNSFSSLDRAFALLPIIKDNTNKTMKEKLNDYKQNSEEYSNPKFHIDKKKL
jgi:curved DNA-binding protein CbpA